MTSTFIPLTSAPAVGLILRSQNEITIFHVRRKLHVLPASAVSEETFYKTGYLIGICQGMPLVSVAAPMPTLEPDVKTATFTMNLTYGLQCLSPVPGDFIPDRLGDAASAEIAHCLLHAARHAKGLCRPPKVHATASAGGVILLYPGAKALTKAA